MLLAVSAKETGAWLNAPPISSVGLRMDDDVIRIAVGLRLGIPMHLSSTPMPSLQGNSIDELGSHGLSCSKNEGSLPRYICYHKQHHSKIFADGGSNSGHQF